MSFIYSRALVEAFLQENCSATDAFAPLSGSPTPQAYLSPDKMTAFSRPSRFGMTFAPLTDGRGAELLTWYLADFPVKTSALQEKAQGLTANAQACGPTWRASLARFDPASSAWKTAQRSLLEDSGECLVTWPRSGMTVRWTVLGAADIGAPHQRDRFWLVGRANTATNGLEERQAARGLRYEPSDVCKAVAHPDSLRQPQPQGCECDQRGRTGDSSLCNAGCSDVERQRNQSERTGPKFGDAGDAGWWSTEPNVGRVADGMAARVDRLKAIGNGQVPLCAATAFRMLHAEFGD